MFRVLHWFFHWWKYTDPSSRYCRICGRKERRYYDYFGDFWLEVE